jgi:uncharacterized protein
MYYNPYIVVPFATWIIAQTIKFSLAAWRGQLDFKYLYASGGMPSVHSAVVCSLAITSLLVDGPNSHLFGFTLLFAAIVMYDSFGVRRSTGEQAVVINMILTSLENDRIKMQGPHTKLREVLGHKPAEVTVGALLGVILGGLFNSSHLTQEINYVIALPGRLEIIIYAAVFVILLVTGLIARIILARRYRGSVVMKKLYKQIFLATQTIGWLGLLAGFGQYQRLPILLARGWAWLLAAGFVLWAVWIIAKFSVVVPAALLEEKEIQRKKKWFSKKPKKRRK